jgi:hypothetical protein
VSHLDPDQLALIALGEPVASDEEREHLASCRECAADVAEMTHAVVVARSTMDETELDVPSARVWDRIAEELALSPAVAADPLGAQAQTLHRSTFTALDAEGEAPPPAETPAPTPAEPGPTEPGPVPPAVADTPPAEPKPRRRSLGVLWALAASIALVLVVGTGVWIGFGRLAPTPIATAALEAFPSHPEAVGTAEVEESRDGARTLIVTLEGEAQADEYREVWLIRNDGAALISVGVLEGKTGSFPIPDGVDLSEYDLVDISFEPIDGDPAHSGDSIVRGQLEPA